MSSDRISFVLSYLTSQRRSDPIPKKIGPLLIISYALYRRVTGFCQRGIRVSIGSKCEAPRGEGVTVENRNINWMNFEAPDINNIKDQLTNELCQLCFAEVRERGNVSLALSITPV